MWADSLDRLIQKGLKRFERSPSFGMLLSMKHRMKYLVKMVTSESKGAENLKGILVAVLYGAVSTSMAFINKAVMNTYDFNYPYFIMTCQMVFTLIVLQILHIGGAIKLPSFTFERSRMFLIPSVCYAINSILQLTALSGMNIPMYGVIRRCIPLANLILASVVLRKGPPSGPVAASVALMTTGCIIAGYGDLSFNVFAYTCGVGSVLTQALYLTLIQKMCKQKMSTTETLQLNSINTLPLLIIASVVNKEFVTVARYNNFHSTGFWFCFLLVISLGCLLNYTLFLCTIVNSALTTSVVGTLKTIVQTAVGFFAFGGVSLNPATIIGIIINLSGGIVYTYAKYMQGQTAQGAMKRNFSLLNLMEVKVESHSNGVVPQVGEKLTHLHHSTPNGNAPSVDSGNNNNEHDVTLAKQ